MFLKKIALINFKNYENSELEFSPKINCFAGDNGVGKTNMLDAIHYLCLCKSYFNPVDTENIAYDKEFAVIQGEFDIDGKTDEIYCGIQRSKRKIFKKNKKEYSKLADHIGLLPVVMISPLDYELILDGGEERRKFMNSVISQYDRDYLNVMIRFNKIIAQRNKLLKEQDNSSFSRDTLEIYNEEIAFAGDLIYSKRKEFTGKLIPIFQKYYNFISGEKEAVELIYQSQLEHGKYSELLNRSAGKDKILQYTTVGPHRDDLVLNLFGHNIRKTGSQGQQKTYLLALKLAQFDFIKEIKDRMPVLLLDDVFDKFDETRVRQIIKLVAEDQYGQIFITHTNLERIKSVLNEIPVEHKLFLVSQGKMEVI